MEIAPLRRRLLAELLGSALLAAVVVGSGIAAKQLSPHDVGLALFENAAATAAGLFAIILMFGSVSGGHFNPAVLIVDALFGGLSWREVAGYVPAQVAGCVLGAILANGMFAKAAVSFSTHHRASPAHLLAEVVATLGLLLVIFSLARTGRIGSVPAGVGAYIGAAYFFTSSTSFANPAITIGRIFTNTFAGIAPASASGFILAQLVGVVIAAAVIRALYPHLAPAEEPAMVLDMSTVLFVCRQNAGRSQMSAALFERAAGDRHRALSAGTAPAEHVHPEVVEVMNELGIDLSDRTPTALTRALAEQANLVITMGCGDECPVIPGKRYLDWDLADPAGEPIETVRAIRDEIARRVESLVAELDAPHGF